MLIGKRFRDQTVQFTTAVGMLVELGDLSRFEHPRQLMAWLGVTPSEHSSGEKRRQGSITKTSNQFSGIDLHSTVHRWALKLLPVLEKTFRGCKRAVGRTWRMDEAYIRIRGEWKYLYRAVDKTGNTVDFLLRAHRDKVAARRAGGRCSCRTANIGRYSPST